MPEHGMSVESLITEWSAIAAKSANWGATGFMGFPDAGNALPVIGAAILVPFLNQNMANQDICAPHATFVEMEIVHWLRQQLGFPVASEYQTLA